jgi:uncharacterized damage-inducible protein DinB
MNRMVEKAVLSLTVLSCFIGMVTGVCVAQQPKDSGSASGQSMESSKQTSAPPRALPASRREAAMMDWQQAKAWTKAYLEAMPAEHYGFKPVPEIRSFVEQHLHAAQGTFSLGALATGLANPYAGKEFSEDKQVHQKEAAIKRVMEAYDFVIEGLKATTDEKLNEAVPARRGTVMAPKWQLLQWAFTNQTHHRGQTTIYLRLKGIVPPPQPAM